MRVDKMENRVIAIMTPEEWQAIRNFMDKSREFGSAMTDIAYDGPDMRHLRGYSRGLFGEFQTALFKAPKEFKVDA